MAPRARRPRSRPRPRRLAAQARSHLGRGREPAGARARRLLLQRGADRGLAAELRLRRGDLDGRRLPPLPRRPVRRPRAGAAVDAPRPPGRLFGAVHRRGPAPGELLRSRGGRRSDRSPRVRLRARGRRRRPVRANRVRRRDDDRCRHTRDRPDDLPDRRVAGSPPAGRSPDRPNDRRARLPAALRRRRGGRRRRAADSGRRRGIRRPDGAPRRRADPRLGRRDTVVQSRRGWYARAEGGFWEGVEGRTTLGDEYRYARYRGEIRRHQPTFHRDRSILLRAMLDRVEPIDGGAIPFWDLPLLDQDGGLRAFSRNRFRDRGALLVNVEYAYPIWDTWDAFLFLDEGQVFRDYADVRLRRFEWSAGAGVRLYSRRGLLLRLQYAIGDEEQNLRFGFEQEF
ncbi:MAG: hypothetical protein ACREQ9_15270 [Candidatus Binatia bacterium]